MKIYFNKSLVKESDINLTKQTFINSIDLVFGDSDIAKLIDPKKPKNAKMDYEGNAFYIEQV